MVMMRKIEETNIELMDKKNSAVNNYGNRSTVIMTPTEYDKTSLIDEFKRSEVRDRDESILEAISSTKKYTIPNIISERYQVKRVLGEGAFGVVYLAEDLTLGRLVAIKQLFKSALEEEDTFDRFIQEARISSKLEHPNVVCVYNIEDDDDCVSIVMEYIGGGNVGELINKQGRIDVLSAAKIMIGVMSGLDASHHMKVCHRDIKSANIMLGIGNAPKITDFGVAHLPVDAGGIINNSEEQKLIIGTPRYIAPELLLGKGITPQCDIYSAGCVFYEMLTGRYVHNLDTSDSWPKINSIIQNEKIISPSEYFEDIPKSILYVLERMLKKDPEERYQSAIEILRDLTFACSNMDSSDIVQAPEMLFANSPQALLYDTIYLLLLDDVITLEERQELNKRAERLGLSESQVREIEERVRTDKGLVSLESLEKLADLIVYFIQENNGEKLNEEQKTYLKEKQKEMKITDVELDVIKADLIF